MKQQVSTHRNNPTLPSPRVPDCWPGTPVRKNGRFINLNHPYLPDWLDVLRWKVQRSPYRNQKKRERWQPEVYTEQTWLGDNDDLIVWLGHSTFYIQLDGIRLLTDPVFFDIVSVKRKSLLPIDPARLTNLDFILLSHDHRDHLDKKSLQLLARQNPHATYLTRLGMNDLVNRFTGSKQIQEAGWYQQFDTGDVGASITFVPTRHWSKRGLTDTNKRLWGGFVIEVGQKRLLFGGDSGYDETNYGQLATVFGSFDYAIIGIGAYEPAWFMQANHQSPEDALKAFTHLNAERLIPMHYGTFDLSDEPLHQPLSRLVEEAERLQLRNRLSILSIGRPYKITR